MFLYFRKNTIGILQEVVEMLLIEMLGYGGLCGPPVQATGDRCARLRGGSPSAGGAGRPRDALGPVRSQTSSRTGNCWLGTRNEKGRCSRETRAERPSGRAARWRRGLACRGACGRPWRVDAHQLGLPQELEADLVLGVLEQVLVGGGRFRF